jgi:quercetin dioxygenase-like cupin family protein
VTLILAAPGMLLHKRETNMRSMLALAALTLLFGLSSAFAQDSPPAGVIVVPPDNVKWKNADSMGKGVQQAVLMGDPSKSGPFAFLLKLPAGTAVPAHTHPNRENITIISGDFKLGSGAKPDESKAQAMPPGSFASVPPNTPHYAFVGKEEAVVQIWGDGPRGMTLVKQEASQ